MDMPKPSPGHSKLAKLAGSWVGEETMHPSPWDPKGGTARGRSKSQLGLSGFALRAPMGAFRFEIGPFLLCAGMGLSVLIGILGAAWPLWRSARLKTVDAIRHLQTKEKEKK